MKPGSKSDQTTCRKQSEVESENTESEIEGGDTDMEKWGEAGIRRRPGTGRQKNHPRGRQEQLQKKRKRVAAQKENRNEDTLLEYQRPWCPGKEKATWGIETDP
jgi:hypothetical protein